MPITNNSRWWEATRFVWWRRPSFNLPYGPIGAAMDAQNQWTKAHWPIIHKMVPTDPLTLTTSLQLIPGMTLTVDAGPVGAEWHLDGTALINVSGASAGNFAVITLYIDGAAYVDRAGSTTSGQIARDMYTAGFETAHQGWAGTSDDGALGPGSHTFEFYANKNAAGGTAAVDGTHTSGVLHLHRF